MLSQSSLVKTSFGSGLARTPITTSSSANQRLQRTWPSFSVSIVAGISGVAFVNALPSPKAGHAAEAQCYAAGGKEASMRWMTVTTIVLCVVNLARCRQSKPDSVIDALGGAVEAPAPDLSLVVHSVAFSPSGKELAVGRDDGAVAVFAVASGELVRSFSESAARVRAVAFSPDGNLIASGGEDHTIRLWMARDGSLLRKLDTGSPSTIWALSFLPADGRLISGVDLALWETGGGQRIKSLVPSSSFQCVAVSPDAQLLAVGASTSLRFWDLKAEVELPTITAHSVTTAGGNTAAIRSVAFSPNGEWLASGSEDNTVKIWKVTDRSEVATLLHPSPQHRYDVQAVAFSPDGTTLVSTDVSVKFWAVPSWTLQRTVTIGDGSLLETLAFSPDGGVLAVANGGRGVDLLDPATGAVLRTLK